MLIDTHCHLNMLIRGYKTKSKFEQLSELELQKCEEFIEQAKMHNVKKIINIGTDLIETQTCIEIANSFDTCFATVGLHPSDAKDGFEKTIESFKEILKEKKKYKIVGIGECGIDKHYQNYDLKKQIDTFETQIKLAIQENLPIIVHSRDADEETYKILEKYKNMPNFKGVIHCYSSDLKQAEKYIGLGFLIGIGGAVTYPKNENLREVAVSLPLEKIILETDAPFLAPQVIRGKTNTPAQIKNIAKFIAEIRNKSLEKIARTTTNAAEQLFQI